MNDRFKFRLWHEKQSEMIELGICPQCSKCSPHNPVNLEECNMMQCTGLKDKNGTLIYEGDIVEVIPDKEYAVIEWNNDTARFDICIVNSKRIYRFATFSGDELEVLGNVYENPELLEAENENS